MGKGLAAPQSLVSGIVIYANLKSTLYLGFWKELWAQQIPQYDQKGCIMWGGIRFQDAHTIPLFFIPLFFIPLFFMLQAKIGLTNTWTLYWLKVTTATSNIKTVFKLNCNGKSPGSVSKFSICNCDMPNIQKLKIKDISVSERSYEHKKYLKTIGRVT